MNLQREQREREREGAQREKEQAQSWRGGVSFTERHHMVSQWRKKVRREQEERDVDLQRGREEKKCLILCLHTSCCQVRECSLSCLTKMCDIHLLSRMTLLDTTINILTGWFSFSFSTWNVLPPPGRMSWIDVNVTLYKCCLLFLRVRHKHIETVAWSCPQCWSLLHSPLDFILICGCMAPPDGSR